LLRLLQRLDEFAHLGRQLLQVFLVLNSMVVLIQLIWHHYLLMYQDLDLHSS